MCPQLQLTTAVGEMHLRLPWLSIELLTDLMDSDTVILLMHGDARNVIGIELIGKQRADTCGDGNVVVWCSCCSSILGSRRGFETSHLGSEKIFISTRKAFMTMVMGGEEGAR